MSSGPVKRDLLCCKQAPSRFGTMLLKGTFVGMYIFNDCLRRRERRQRDAYVVTYPAHRNQTSTDAVFVRPFETKG